MKTYTDEHIDYWAEQFIAVGMRAATTFEAFMALSVPMRVRRVTQFGQLLALQERIERQVPDAGLRDNVLVDPIHHDKRVYRKPWWFRAYRARGRK